MPRRTRRGGGAPLTNGSTSAMGNLLHVCLYNVEASASEELQGHLSRLNFVRLVAEVSTPEELAAVLENRDANLVFFHLDPDPGSIVSVIDQVSTSHPEVAMIAVSHQMGPQVILEPMRAGCDQFVCEPIDQADLAQAVATVATKRLASSPKSRCVCVVSPSGGSGATSIACNLAMEIGLASERSCALVDFDLQFGDCALNFDCDPKYTLADLAESAAHIDQSLIQSTAVELPNNVALLSRPKLLEQQDLFTADVTHRIIEQVAAAYENVVVDLPNQLNEQTAAILRQADLVLIVCQLLVPNIRNVGRYAEALTRLGLPEDRAEVIVNRCDGRSGRITTKDVQQAVNKPAFGTVPNDYQFVARSIDFGRPIALLDERNPVRTAIRRIATQILTKSSGHVAEDRTVRSKGFLERLLTR